MIVYVVEEGEYSDRKVRAVFDSPEAAKKFTMDNKGEYPCFSISAFNLNDDKMPIAIVSKMYRSVIVIETGEISNRSCEEFNSIIDDEDDDGFQATKTYITSWSYKSQDHADKLAVEARQKHLREAAAKEEWRKQLHQGNNIYDP